MLEADGDRPTPTWKRFFAELKRRRVFRVMAIYGGAAFALLEAVDLIAGSLPLPTSLQSTLTVLVLAGFPVAVVLAWVFDITPEGVQRTDPARTRELDEIAAQPARVRWPAGLLALVGSVLFLLAAWSAASGLGWLASPGPREAYAVADPLGSYVVLPFEHLGQSERERDLVERAATRLGRQLRGWESVRVVSDFALAGAIHDLGVESAVLPSLDVGLDVAKAQRVGTLIALTAEVEGDSATLEALLYDVGQGHEVSRPIQVTESVNDVDGLVAPVAQEILQLRNRSVPLETLRRESASPVAHREFQEGLDALYAWRLPEAESRFRLAMDADSMFALPAHYLALTLYWMTARNPELILNAGPEIARLTSRADGLASLGDLRSGLREHVAAFRAFWEGDYEEARTGFRRLIAEDSTDVEAWLLLGAVEFEDPWLVERPDGTLVPRRSLNQSRVAFETAARLAPDLPLSYGLLFQIDEEVAESAILKSCEAFERPGGERIPPYADREARDQVAFCPVPGDSVVWVPHEQLADIDPSFLAKETAGMLSSTAGLLERWVAVRPNQARPHEESAAFALWQRNLAGCSVTPAKADSLGALALEHLESALALRADTTPEDLVRLAMLRLAADDIAGAESLIETAFDRYRSESSETAGRGPTVPQSTANLFLATGRPARAHEILRPIWDDQTFGTFDPDAEDGVLMAGPVEPHFGQLRVAGSTGVHGPLLDSLFAALERVWSPPRYTGRQAASISHAALQLGIGPALAASPAVLVDWSRNWADAGFEVPSALAGLAAAQRGDTAAARLLDLAIDELDRSERVSVTDLHLAGMLALRTGYDSIATELFGRLAACPLGLDEVDLGWGLRTQSYLHRGRAYLAAGDRDGARGALAEVARYWEDAELILQSDLAATAADTSGRD
jgi:tetratricopeptide (TPR) repeat protein